MASSIIYGDETYELSGTEYCELEDLLDRDNLREVEIPWIIYRFLNSKGYDPPKPAVEKPDAFSGNTAMDALFRNAESANQAKNTGNVKVNAESNRRSPTTNEYEKILREKERLLNMRERMLRKQSMQIKRQLKKGRQRRVAEKPEGLGKYIQNLQSIGLLGIVIMALILLGDCNSIPTQTPVKTGTASGKVMGTIGLQAIPEAAPVVKTPLEAPTAPPIATLSPAPKPAPSVIAPNGGDAAIEQERRHAAELSKLKREVERLRRERLLTPRDSSPPAVKLDDMRPKSRSSPRPRRAPDQGQIDYN